MILSEEDSRTEERGYDTEREREREGKKMKLNGRS